MMNVGNPELAFSFAGLPSEGIGLARMGFIINRQIGIHPKALIEFHKQDADLQAEINERITGYASPVFYVDKIAEGVATLAASVYPRKAIVHMSDFKSNEYANLLGGNSLRAARRKPDVGFRGAARYVSDDFAKIALRSNAKRSNACATIRAQPTLRLWCRLCAP